MATLILWVGPVEPPELALNAFGARLEGVALALLGVREEEEEEEEVDPPVLRRGEEEGDVVDDPPLFPLVVFVGEAVAVALFALTFRAGVCAAGPEALFLAGWLVELFGVGRGVVRWADPGALGSSLVVVAIFVYYLIGGKYGCQEELLVYRAREKPAQVRSHIFAFLRRNVIMLPLLLHHS